MNIKDKLEKLKGIGVKCDSAEHGKEIIEVYSGIISTEKYGGSAVDSYYGVTINGEFRRSDFTYGKMFNQILTLDQVKELVKDKHKNFFYDEPKEMLVSDDDVNYKSRIIIGEYNGLFLTRLFCSWRYAKEIPKKEPEPEQDEQFCLIKEFLEWKKNNENK